MMRGVGRVEMFHYFKIEKGAKSKNYNCILIKLNKLRKYDILSKTKCNIVFKSCNASV